MDYHKLPRKAMIIAFISKDLKIPRQLDCLLLTAIGTDFCACLDFFWIKHNNRYGL